MKIIALTCFFALASCAAPIKVVRMYEGTKLPEDQVGAFYLSGYGGYPLPPSFLRESFSMDGRPIVPPLLVELAPGQHCFSHEDWLYRYIIARWGAKILSSTIFYDMISLGTIYEKLGKSGARDRYQATPIPGGNKAVTSHVEVRHDFQVKAGHLYHVQTLEYYRFRIKGIPRRIVSPNGKTTIFIDMHEKVRFLGQYKITVEDDKDKKIYDKMSFPIISPNGKRVAFFGVKGVGSVVSPFRYTAVLDGNESKEYQGIGGASFSLDSQRFAFSSKEAKKWLMNVDGKESEKFDLIGSGPSIFSSDSKRIAFIAKEGKKWIVIVDGVKSQQFDEILRGTPVFSPDSQRVAFAARVGDKWTVVVDGKQSNQYDQVLLGKGSFSPVFSPDSQRVTFAAMAGDKWTVVVDGKESKKYDYFVWPSIDFSPNSQRMAFAAVVDNQWVVVVDGKESKKYDEILLGTPVFSPDSQGVAFAARVGDKWTVVVNEKESEQYDGIKAILLANGEKRFDSLRFSPDGKKILYTARKAGKEHYIEEELSKSETTR